jgi:hypothetical protein
MANPLAGRYALAFEPTGGNFLPPNFSYGKTSPELFSDLLNRSQPKSPSNLEFGLGEYFQRLPQEKQDELLFEQARGELQIKQLKESGLLPQGYSLEDIRRNREAEMETAQKYGERSLEQAVKYKMLMDIPKSIGQMFSNMAANKLYGAQMAIDAGAKTLQAFPSLNVTPYVYNPQKYLD